MTTHSVGSGNWLWLTSIKQKISVLLAVLVFVIVGAGIFVVSALQATQDHVNLVEALGRQQMLTERVVKAAFAISLVDAIGRQADVGEARNRFSDEMQVARQIFSETLSAIKIDRRTQRRIETRRVGF